MDLQNLVGCSLWHAFHALDSGRCGRVPASQLRVMTHNLCTLLEVPAEQRVDVRLPELHPEPLTFPIYLQFLADTLLPCLSLASRADVRRLQSGCEQVCWLLYGGGAVDRAAPLLDADCVRRLLAVFCVLAELGADSQLGVHAVLNAGEAEFVTGRLVQALGRQWDGTEFRRLCDVIYQLRFPVLLALLERHYTAELAAGALREAVSEVHQLVVDDVLRRDFVYRRGELMRVYRGCWLELTPDCVRYYRRREDTRPAGSMPLKADAQVRCSGDGARANRLTVSCAGRSLHLAAPDCRSRLLWLSALQTATAFSSCLSGYQRHLSRERSAAWHARASRQHRADADVRAELQSERELRAAAEATAAALVVQQADESRRLQALEEIRSELEQRLHEEKQAKRDEELVRSAQSRALRDEWQRRELLEQLQLELRQLLAEERQKREAFQQLQRTKQQQLDQAERRLQEVEAGRVHLDAELQAARSNLMAAERSKGLVESRLRVREREVSSSLAEPNNNLDREWSRSGSMSPCSDVRPVSLLPMSFLDRCSVSESATRVSPPSSHPSPATPPPSTDLFPPHSPSSSSAGLPSYPSAAGGQPVESARRCETTACDAHDSSTDSPLNTSLSES